LKYFKPGRLTGLFYDTFSRMEEVLQLAVELAQIGGERMRNAAADYANLVVHSKGCDDLVTDVDLWIEGQVINAVRSRFPKHAILAEEGVHLKRSSKSFIKKVLREDICWVVDPLDGTANFASQIPHCCVSIGVLEKGKRKLAVVYDPFRDELFTAEQAKGAFLNGKPIQVSSKGDLMQSIIATGIPTDVRDRWEEYRRVYDRTFLDCCKVRMMGSTVLELCWTACGRLDGFIQYRAFPWDFAAAVLIVEEAGGVVSNFGQTPEEYFDILGHSVVAGCPEINQQLLGLAGGLTQDFIT
jgi:myo-inositol-1(or 4)-monophosphatase